MPVYFTINTLTELACFLAALVFLWGDKEPAWKLFIFYLALTCLTEMGGIYLRRMLHMHNSWLYNLFVLFECSTNSYFFYYLYGFSVGRRGWMLLWPPLFMVIYLTELFLRHFETFASVTTTIMSVVFVLASIYYYYLLLADKAYIRLSQYAPFWWVNGSILFYFGSTAANLFFDYLVNYSAPVFSNSIHYIISTILDILLYCCWAYAFICRWLQRKSSTS